MQPAKVEAQTAGPLSRIMGQCRFSVIKMYTLVPRPVLGVYRDAEAADAHDLTRGEALREIVRRSKQQG